MAWPRNDKLHEMYAMYQKGYSLTQVGAFYGVTRQSVYGLFKWNGLKARSKKQLEFVEFNGSKYTIRNTGYYARTDGERTLLHRDIWEFYNGEIPEGYDVHHKDENKLNNVTENLECLLKAEHTKLHQHGQNQHTKKNKTKYAPA